MTLRWQDRAWESGHGAQTKLGIQLSGKRLLSAVKDLPAEQKWRGGHALPASRHVFGRSDCYGQGRRGGSVAPVAGAIGMHQAHDLQHELGFKIAAGG